MKFSIIILIFIYVFSFQINAQRIVKISKIDVLEYSKIGFTTSSAKGYLNRELKNKQEEAQLLSITDVELIEGILSRTKFQKILPMKVGNNFLFAKLTTLDYLQLDIIIGRNFILDYTNNKIYKVKFEKDKKILFNIVNKSARQ
jgi:hypothetical protein